MSTLKDIAQIAGVSSATVSRVLNGGQGISAKTCDDVLRIAKELNYIPNYSAKILAGKRSKMIGMVVPEIDSNYFSRIIYEVERQMHKAGYSLIIINTHNSKEKEKQALNTLCTYNVAGIFLTCTINYELLDEYKPILNAQNIPLVLLEARAHRPDYHYIMVDDEIGMVDAIRHLLSKGYKRVGFIGDYVLDILRSDLYLSALVQCGLDPADNPIYSHPSCRFEQCGYEMMQTILADPHRPSAFLAGYDDIAIGAMRAVTEAGLSIPEDIAIIGNDNIRESSYLSKALTTLSPPVDKMAIFGTRIMLQAIHGESDGVIQHISLRPDLIIRETT